MRVGDHVPAGSVGPVFGHGFERISGVAQAFGHLLAVFVQHQTIRDHVFEGHAIKYHHGDGVEGIKPAPRLVNPFGDEVGGVAEPEFVLVFKRIMPLCVGHGTRVEPYVDQVEFAVQRFAVVGYQHDLVNVGAVQVFGHFLGFAQNRIGFADFFLQLLDRTDALFLCPILAAPDGQRDAPVTRAGKVPVLQVFKPFAKTPFTRCSGFPVDGLVQFKHTLLHRRSLDEPTVERVIQHRAVGTPAVWIRVYVFFGPEQFVLFF